MKLLKTAMSLFLLVAPAPTPQQETKARIEGVVFRAGSSNPVAGAQMTLARQPSAGAVGASTIPGVTSDAQGRFSFSNLEPGAYRLLIAGAGYARQEYGQRNERVPGATIAVVSGQTIKDIVVRLTPTGNISGRVVDIDRRPVAAIPVQVMRATYSSDGKKTFQAVQSAITDDRGEYRIYWITPDRYYLNAADSSARPGGIVGQSLLRNTSFPTTYYPGVTDPDAAGIIEVLPDGELTADFVLSVQELHSIRGRLLDTTTGRWPDRAAVNLITDRSSIGSSSWYNPLNGTFEMRDIPPGSYTVTAQLPNTAEAPRSGAASGPAPSLPVTFAMARVTVAGSDVDGVVLNLMPSVSVSGRLRVEGMPLSAVPGVDRMRVRLDPVARGGRSGMSGSIGEDGTFRIDGVIHGEYRQSMWSMPQSFFLKESRFDSGNKLNESFQIQGSDSQLDIVLSPNAGQIEGTITDELLKPTSGIFVILIPDQHRDRSELYQNLNSDDKGHFTMRNVRPGAYKVFAFEFLEQYGYFDPDFFRRFERLGTPVNVTESAKLKIDLKTIPATPR